MPAMVDPPAARLFEQLLRERGHTVHTGARAAEIVARPARGRGAAGERGGRAVPDVHHGRRGRPTWSSWRGRRSSGGRDYWWTPTNRRTSRPSMRRATRPRRRTCSRGSGSWWPSGLRLEPGTGSRPQHGRSTDDLRRLHGHEHDLVLGSPSPRSGFGRSPTPPTTHSQRAARGAAHISKTGLQGPDPGRSRSGRPRRQCRGRHPAQPHSDAPVLYRDPGATGAAPVSWGRILHDNRWPVGWRLPRSRAPESSRLLKRPICWTHPPDGCPARSGARWAYFQYAWTQPRWVPGFSAPPCA